MFRFAADENFNNRIVRGLLRRRPDLDIVRVQDAGLAGADHPTILNWAAQKGRVLLTHEADTMAAFAYQRVRAGAPMPGIFELPRAMPIGQAIEDLLVLAELSLDGEWDGQVRYLPRR